MEIFIIKLANEVISKVLNNLIKGTRDVRPHQGLFISMGINFTRLHFIGNDGIKCAFEFFEN